MTLFFIFAGFESILEGIYGPRLLQDLNIFDGEFYVCGNIHLFLVLENSAFFDVDEYSYDSPSECEPEAVDDWSMNANCSFCNLQLEKLNVSQPSKATEKACLYWGVS